MPSLLLFSAEDIGKNYRLLRHAKSFSSLPGSKVVIFAPDISSLPKEIEKAPNIIHKYFYVFHLPYFLDSVLFPIHYLFSVLQCFYIYFYFYFSNSQSFDFVLSSSSPVFDPMFSRFLAFLFRAPLILDISLFKYTSISRTSNWARKIEKNSTKYANYRICSTRALQVVLQLRNTPAAIIHDPSGSLFVPNPQIRNEVFSFLGEKKEFLIAVPVPYFDIGYINIITKACDQLNSQNVSAAFVIFGSPKSQKEIEARIDNFSNSKVSLHFVPINTDAYAHIMGCCDFGILLSGTRYGLDFSPELTEMVSCCIPIVVGKGGCTVELVRDHENGFIFGSEEQLSQILKNICVDKSVNLNKMKESLKSSPLKWENEWKEFFEPLLTKKKSQ